MALVCRDAGDPGYVAVVDDVDGEVASAWGAEPGEVLVVRPDGLLLARGPVESLTGLPKHLLRGGTVAAQAGEAGETLVALPAAEARREAAWLALSDGINAVPADDREGFLARLALLLGDQTDPDSFLQAVSTAASVR